MPKIFKQANKNISFFWISFFSIAISHLFWFLLGSLIGRANEVFHWIDGKLKVGGIAATKAAKKIFRLELSTGAYFGWCLVLAAALWAYLRWKHLAKMPEAAEFLDGVVSFLNFAGVMLVARGVIILRGKSTTLETASKDPVEFAKESLEVFKEASLWCEVGTVVIGIGYLVDVAARTIK
ncbi:hypothetical protein [Burkholderia gladioli]|uniref:hypothetical protein n=1 Tax=Burkholderia gladioli TaxID=28095 RepID=UPI00163F4779|nr:hypothetical protein [Burkholderia gladioli]